MKVKCASCGAPQENEEKCNCIYCGNYIENAINTTETEINDFKIATYEYQRGDFTKSTILFDEILKSNPTFYLGWVFKIFGSFSGKILKYNNEYHRLYSNANKCFSLEDFNKDIDFLLKDFKSESNIKYLEKNLLLLFSTLVNSDYTKLAGKDSVSKKSIFSLCLSANEDFILLLNNISKIFSNEFQSNILDIINHFFTENGFNNTIPQFYDFENNFDTFLTNHIVKSRLFISNILDLYADSIQKDVDRQLNNYSNDKTYKLYLPKESTYKQGINFIDSLSAKFPNNELESLIKNHILRIDTIKSKIQLSTIKNENKKGCFIATATMGDYNHPVVIELRMFRDNWLLKRSWGFDFTNWYYVYGPKAASVIDKSIILRKLTLLLIVKPLHLISKIIRMHGN